uniref:Uncharacterized protein n=1 Tax=Callorhinchus milii TaxID=7868 RepID=A0A4W3KBD4_CALMI
MNVKTSPKPGSAAMGSPGRPSPTNFAQTSFASESFVDPSHKFSSSTNDSSDRSEKCFTSFKPPRNFKNSQINKYHIQQYQPETTSPPYSNVTIVDYCHGNVPVTTHENDPNMTPLNLSKKGKNSAVEEEKEGRNIIKNALQYRSESCALQMETQVQDMPLNLSVKTLYKNGWQTPENSSQQRADVESRTQLKCTSGSPDSAVEELNSGKDHQRASERKGTRERQVDSTTQAINVAKSAKSCNDEHKQSAAVALCQLAVCGNGKFSNELTASRTDLSEHKSRNPKRSHSKEVNKPQAEAKHAKSNDCGRIFNLRKRPRVA